MRALASGGSVCRQSSSKSLNISSLRITDNHICRLHQFVLRRNRQGWHSPPEPTRIPARSARCCSAALRRATPCRNCLRSTRGRKPKPSYSEERNTKTATVTATPMPTPKPAPIATPMPMLATAAPTPAPSTTPTNTLNGKAATPQREIFVPWLRDTGLTRQYQSIRLTPWVSAVRSASTAWRNPKV